METQIENTPVIGEEQSKLAELLKLNHKLVGDAYLFAKKRRDVSANALLSGVRAIEALRENSKLCVSYFKDDEARESYCKDLYESLTK